jgi:hypothetical protein
MVAPNYIASIQHWSQLHTLTSSTVCTGFCSTQANVLGCNFTAISFLVHFSCRKREACSHASPRHQAKDPSIRSEVAVSVNPPKSAHLLENAENKLRIRPAPLLACLLHGHVKPCHLCGPVVITTASDGNSEKAMSACRLEEMKSMRNSDGHSLSESASRQALRRLGSSEVAMNKVIDEFHAALLADSALGPVFEKVDFAGFTQEEAHFLELAIADDTEAECVHRMN